MPELYWVSTLARELNGCRNVHVAWFRTDPRGAGCPYEHLIEGYSPGDPYAESAVDELFTREEADALKKYLDERHGDVGITSIERVNLPIGRNMAGIGCIAVGGGDDFYMLDHEERYSLPFNVWGYFNLRGCELVDEPGETYRHYVHVLSVDDGGRVHMEKETQLEARAREDTPTPAMLESYMHTGRYSSPDSDEKG